MPEALDAIQPLSLGQYTTAGKDGGRYEGLNQDNFLTRQTEGLSFREADSLIRNTLRDAARATAHEDGGSTASIAVVTKDNQLVVGQVGDSPVIVYVRDGETGQVTAHELTRDHSPNNPDEARRIQREGGFVANGRVNDHLAVARSLGDKSVGNGVSSEAEIYSHDLKQYLTHPDSRVWVVVGSDGITERSSPQALAEEFAGDSKSPQTHARNLAYRAMEAGSTDNITPLVAEIRPGNSQSAVMGVMDGHGKGGEHVALAARDILEHQLDSAGYRAITPASIPRDRFQQWVAPENLRRGGNILDDDEEAGQARQDARRAPASEETAPSRGFFSRLKAWLLGEPKPETSNAEHSAGNNDPAHTPRQPSAEPSLPKGWEPYHSSRFGDSVRYNQPFEKSDSDGARRFEAEMKRNGIAFAWGINDDKVYAYVPKTMAASLENLHRLAASGEGHHGHPPAQASADPSLPKGWEHYQSSAFGESVRYNQPFHTDTQERTPEMRRFEQEMRGKGVAVQWGSKGNDAYAYVRKSDAASVENLHHAAENPKSPSPVENGAGHAQNPDGSPFPRTMTPDGKDRIVTPQEQAYYEGLAQKAGFRQDAPRGQTSPAASGTPEFQNWVAPEGLRNIPGANYADIAREGEQLGNNRDGSPFPRRYDDKGNRIVSPEERNYYQNLADKIQNPNGGNNTGQPPGQGSQNQGNQPMPPKDATGTPQTAQGQGQPPQGNPGNQNTPNPNGEGNTGQSTGTGNPQQQSQQQPEQGQPNKSSPPNDPNTQPTPEKAPTQAPEAHAPGSQLHAGGKAGVVLGAGYAAYTLAENLKSDGSPPDAAKTASQVASVGTAGANLVESGASLAGMETVQTVGRRLGVVGAVTVGTIETVDGIAKGDKKEIIEGTAGTAGAMGGAWAGVAAGAAIGSAVPIVGTAIGGFVGGLIGAYVGSTTATYVAEKAVDALSAPNQAAAAPPGSAPTPTASNNSPTTAPPSPPSLSADTLSQARNAATGARGCQNGSAVSCDTPHPPAPVAAAQPNATQSRGA